MVRRAVQRAPPVVGGGRQRRMRGQARVTAAKARGARASIFPACPATARPQGVLDERMKETGENWRLVYKSLLLLEYMVKHGPLVSACAGACLLAA